MRQQDGGDLGEILGLILFDPKQLRNRVTGQHGIPCQSDDAGLSAEFMGDLGALSLRGSVAPELGGTHRLVIRTESDQPMLLTAHADAGDLGFVRAELLQALSHAAVHRVDPALRMLFQMTGGQAFDQIIGAVSGSENPAAVEVENDGFRALRAAVDTEKIHGAEWVKCGGDDGGADLIGQMQCHGRPAHGVTKGRAAAKFVSSLLQHSARVNTASHRGGGWLASVPTSHEKTSPHQIRRSSHRRIPG